MSTTIQSGTKKISHKIWSDYRRYYYSELTITGKHPNRKFSIDLFSSESKDAGVAVQIGTIDPKREKLFFNKMEELSKAKEVLKECKISPSQASRGGFKVKKDGKMRCAMDFLGGSHNSLKNIYTMWPKLEKIDKDIINQVANDARYDVYIKRQKE